MRPEDRDAGYVWDMLDAARTIRDFTLGVTLDDYLLDRKLQLASNVLLKSSARRHAWCLRVSKRNIRTFRGNKSSRSATCSLISMERSAKIASGWWRLTGSQNQPRALPLISRQSPRLVCQCLLARFARLDRHAAGDATSTKFSFRAA